MCLALETKSWANANLSAANNQSAELPRLRLLILIWFRCHLAYLPAYLYLSVCCLPGISYEIDKLGLNLGVNKAVCGRLCCRGKGMKSCYIVNKLHRPTDTAYAVAFSTYIYAQPHFSIKYHITWHYNNNNNTVYANVPHLIFSYKIVYFLVGQQRNIWENLLSHLQKKKKKTVFKKCTYIHFFGTQTDCLGGGFGRETKKKHN